MFRIRYMFKDHTYRVLSFYHQSYCSEYKIVFSLCYHDSKKNDDQLLPLKMRVMK